MRAHQTGMHTLRLPTATCSADRFFEESERNRETSRQAGRQSRQGKATKAKGGAR